MSSLIATPQAIPSKTMGEALSVVKDLTNAIENANSGDYASATVDAALLVLDTAAMIVDPIAALAGSVASWLMTYVEPLPSMIDDLVGSPTEVAAQSQTWLNIKAQIETAKDELDTATSSVLADWQGATADTYRELSDGIGQIMTGLGVAAAGVSGNLKQASDVIDIIRKIIIMLVSSLVGALISWIVEIGLTVGFGTPAVIGQATVKIASTTTKAATWTEKVVTTVGKIADDINTAGKILPVSLGTIKTVQKSLTLISVKNVLATSKEIYENMTNPEPQVAP